MNKILVTGGTGFLGSNLCSALLRSGHSVRLLRRVTSHLGVVNDLDVEHVTGDLRDPDSVRRAVRGCDTVFHAGALVSYWRKQRQEMFETNIDGTRNVVDACLAEGVEKLIHTSSIAAVGYSPSGEPADESTRFNWDAFDIGYRISKHRAEEEIHKGLQKGLEAVIVNPSVIMGERDIHFHGGQIIRDVYKKRLFYYVDGGVNVAYVGDVVQGHLAAASRGRTGERYILAGENMSYRDMLAAIAAEVGGLRPLFRLPFWVARSIASVSEMIADIRGSRPWVGRELVAGLGVRNWFSSEKAQRELGYTITPFREAVRRTFEWYKSKKMI